MSAKSFADSIVPIQPPPQRREWRRPLVLGVLLFCIWSWKLHECFYDRNAVLHPTSHPFPVYTDWHDVPTSEKLHWVRCALPDMPPETYLCARLTVPMDYQRPLNQSSDNPKVHVAMVLLPAPGHGLDTRRFSESPLVLNPGGPGGVGTAFVYPPKGPSIQAAVGGDVDLLGFDPRGIGATVPSADCFGGGADASADAKRLALMRRMTWITAAHDVGLPNGTNEAMDALANRARAVSKLCLQNHGGDDSAFRYMSTPNVAADIKSIVEAHDDWLEDNGFETVALGAGVRSPSEAAPPSTKRKLVYWGFSYGTLIGQTFAAMYPDSVGRLVLDGVVNSHVYDRPTWWVSTMRDANPILDRFYYYCHLAGGKCDLFREGDEPDDIKARYEGVMDKLRAEPLIVISKSNMPVVLMEADIKKIVFSALYAPVMLFPLIGTLINILHTGADISDFVSAPDLTPMCSAEFRMPAILDVSESQPAVSCSDQQIKRNETLDELYKRTSSYTSFADVLMSLMMSCEGWSFEAKYPSPDWDADLNSPDPVNTSFPILFAGNTYDPVTPLGAALDMTQNFVNAGVFELQAEGHCTLAAISVCAVTKIRDYLQKGIVPPHPAVATDGTLSGWDKCKSDERPWKPFQADATMHAEELHVLRAFRDVHAEIIGLLIPATKLRLYDM
ncbi:hypothetical protein CkaCkLH20_01436 [Colletotrichum karsti]|uniref:Peptidase S33 tripeptidyl aminopeptidase-like C-terminal domain-containing protein n=1 Tax=Colletotrichum karsti TaxID=1095194 RepID=A0A9P6IHX0_9PEZI|nr:uncharacterized protein CkaCkLH20_01436 [Colletotrichum karsti]KAF9881286.1 hypothetical protein CkaCkLH20_01436 [Colletotrichum karsti]